MYRLFQFIFYEKITKKMYNLQKNDFFLKNNSTSKTPK